MQTELWNVHVYIYNERNEFLIQKRSTTKASGPGIWSITGGAVCTGEDSRTAAVRETYEELGVKLCVDDLVFVSRFRQKNGFLDIWFVKVSFTPDDCVLPSDEVDEVKFVPPEVLLNDVLSDEGFNFFGHGYKFIIQNYIYRKTTELIIRTANSADAEALFEMNETFNGESATDIDYLRHTLAINTGEYVCIAYVGDIPAGFCCAQLLQSICYGEPYAELSELFVKDSFRRMGIASALAAHIERVMNNRGVRSFQLLTGSDNTSAQTFYESMGYKKNNELSYRKRLNN